MSTRTFTTSIIIPCYNSAKTLDMQLESLSRQINAEPFEVVVVDNCSTDDTQKVALKWMYILDLRIVEALKHQGVSYARNRGISLAKGDKLIFLDADDVVPPEYVSYCQRSLEEYPLCVMGFDPVDDLEFSAGLQHVLSLISHKSLEYRPPLPGEEDPNWPILPGGSFGARRSVMFDMGGFDISTEPGAEDNDLAFRLLEAGYDLRVQRSTTIAYRISTKPRPLSLYYRRAKSTALLAERYKKWSYGPFASHSPLLAIVKTLASGVRIIVMNPSRIKSWTPRLATDIGIMSGWINYRLLRRSPLPRTGVGFNE
ncbi:glycosyltransferase family 2 protein [Rothia sp. 88186D007BW]